MPTSLQFRGTLFQQTLGTPMSFALLPVPADIFTESFRAMALESFFSQAKNAGFDILMIDSLCGLTARNQSMAS